MRSMLFIAIENLFKMLNFKLISRFENTVNQSRTELSFAPPPPFSRVSSPLATVASESHSVGRCAELTLPSAFVFWIRKCWLQ